MGAAKNSIPEKLPFIPSEAEINDLIAGTSKYKTR